MTKFLSTLSAAFLLGSTLVAQSVGTAVSALPSIGRQSEQVQHVDWAMLSANMQTTIAPKPVDQQAVDTYFGYANRKPAKIASTGQNKAGFVGGFIELPDVSGNAVKGVKFYVAIEDPADAVIYVATKDASGTNTDRIVQAAKRFQAQKGWNEVAFDEAYTIPQNKVVAVGYQVMATGGKNAKPISFDLESDRFMGRDYAMFDATPMNKGSKIERVMESRPQAGNILIFADIDDKQGKLTNLMGVTGVKITSEKPNADGEYTPNMPVEVAVYVSNFGRSAIKTIEGTVMDGTTDKATKDAFKQEVNIPAFTSTIIKVKSAIKTVKKGLGTLVVSVDKINGVDTKTSALPQDNFKVISYKVTTSGGAVERNSLLIERFTTEKCGNCPAADMALESIIEAFTKNKLFESLKINIVAHHSGFYTDFMTLPESEKLLGFTFAKGMTYAPAVMFNRVMVGDALVQSFLEKDRAQLQEAIQKAISPEQPVDLSKVEARIEGGKIKVSVKGWAGDVMRDQLRISAIITESQIEPKAQQGMSGYKKGKFIHNNAARQFLTPFNGAPVTFKKDAGTFTFEIESAELKNKDWKMENLKLVVFAHNDVTWSKVQEREVFASTTLDYKTMLATRDILPEDVPAVAVNNGYLTVTGAARSIEVYDMVGRLVSADLAKQLARGVYVVKVNTAHGPFVHKVVVD